MKLTTAQRDAVVTALSHPLGSVELRCDGHTVQAVVARASQKTLSYEVFVYVDGMFEGKRLSKDDLVGGKFYPTRKRSVYSAAKRADLEKAVGKRAARRHFNLDAFVEYRWPSFRTGRSFISHIEKHNDSIELVRPNVGERD